MYENSELNAFQKINLVVKFLIEYQMIFQGRVCIKLLNLVDNHCLQYYNGLILLL